MSPFPLLIVLLSVFVCFSFEAAAAGTYTYNICNGFSNQILYHAANIAHAKGKGQNVLIPDHFIVNGVQHSSENVLPSASNSVPFSKVFDSEHLLMSLRSLGIKAKFHAFDLSGKNAASHQPSCDGMGAFQGTNPSLVRSIIEGFRPSKDMDIVIKRITAKIDQLEPGNGICLHHRDGNDWHSHCKAWSLIDDGIYRGNCESLDEEPFLETLKHRGLSDSSWVYYVGDHAPPDELSSYNVLTKEQSLSSEVESMLRAIKPGQPIRDLWALVDFFVCSGIRGFIGNSVSTFSALQIAIRNSQYSYWYNSQSIPLADFWNVYQMPIVYTFTELSEGSGKLMLKASIRSLRDQMPFNSIHVIYHGDKDVEFQTWMGSMGVILHHQYNPVWKDTIERSRKHGDPQASHLFLHEGNYFGTWQRIDIPKYINSEYCLLLDADTIVMKPFGLADFGLNISKTFAMSDEADKINKPHNAGVTLFNVPYARKTYKAFLKYIMEHEETPIINGVPGDQGAYLDFYFKDYKSNPSLFLPIRFNYKPYWSTEGETLDPLIVHFHGYKPAQFLSVAMGDECSGAGAEVCRWAFKDQQSALCPAMIIFGRYVKEDAVVYCRENFSSDSFRTKWCQNSLVRLVSENRQCKVSFFSNAVLEAKPSYNDSLEKFTQKDNLSSPVPVLELASTDFGDTHLISYYVFTFAFIYCGTVAVFFMLLFKKRKKNRGRRNGITTSLC